MRKEIRINRLISVKEHVEHLQIEKWLIDVGDILEFDLEGLARTQADRCRAHRPRPQISHQGLR